MEFFNQVEKSSRNFLLKKGKRKNKFPIEHS